MKAYLAHLKTGQGNALLVFATNAEEAKALAVPELVEITGEPTEEIERVVSAWECSDIEIFCLADRDYATWTDSHIYRDVAKEIGKVQLILSPAMAKSLKRQGKIIIPGTSEIPRMNVTPDDDEDEDD